MNKRGYYGAWLLMAMAALFVAKDSFAAEQVKIGYVDLRVALNESDAGKKAKVELESLIKTKQTAIDERGKTIEKLKGELEKQTSVLSAEARKAKEDEIERTVRDYQRLVQDAQAEVKKKENEVTGSILTELREVINKIANEDSYTLIFENVGGIIIYSKKDLDITDRVVKSYNESKKQKK